MHTVDEIKKCYNDFTRLGLWSEDKHTLHKNFLKWSLKNHPDKNINNTELYSHISNCSSLFNGDFDEMKKIAKYIFHSPVSTSSPVSPPYTKKHSHSRRSNKRKSKRSKRKSNKRKSKRSKRKSHKRKSKRSKRKSHKRSKRKSHKRSKRTSHKRKSHKRKSKRSKY